ncbi:Arylsulfatase [Planctomycetes bacterium Pla163]|uniref:Arylsulfatase n=1 Tax=Rohdeia mirabilis TaxID=2528008 RepID=A0A518CZ43_9BACT|nr:Arylsulfatase [Planctomycetes bacterium Pla163]
MSSETTTPWVRERRSLARGLATLVEIACLTAAARAGLLLALEERLSAISLDGALASVLFAAGTGAVAAALVTIAPGRVRSVALVLAALAIFLATFGWPSPDQALAFWPTEGTAVDGLRYGLCGAVAVVLALRLLRPPRSARVQLGSALVALVLVGVVAPRVARRAEALRPPILDWRVRSSVLESPELYRVLKSHSNRPVESEIFTTTTATNKNGGPRPALVMTPPSRVRVEIPPEWAELGARLDLAAGLDEDSWKELGKRRGVRFTARVGDATVFERVLVHQDYAGPPLEESTHVREWHEGLVELEGVEEVELEVALTDGSSVSKRFVAGFANLLIEVPHELRRALNSRLAPSLVFVVIDTMRADAFDPALDGETPNMAALARRGTNFERAYSASSWTWPSTASLLTALTPLEHGVEDSTSNYLSERWSTLAEQLQESGFATGAWSMNPLVSPAKNFDQGFTTFHVTDWERASTVTDDVCAWIEQHRSERFFLFLQFTDPHGPYDPPTEVRELYGVEDPQGYSHDDMELLMRKGRERNEIEQALWPRWVEHAHALYDLEVHDVDRAIGRIEETLRAAGLDDRTVVVLTSDHGEEFLEHGSLGHGPQLFEESIHVPLLVAGPGVPAGVVDDRVTPNRFTAPTLLRLLGVEATGNLVGPDLFERAGEYESVLLSTAIGNWRGVGRRDIFGVREGQWLYHLGIDPNREGRRNEALFDLSESPIATENLAREEGTRSIAANFRERVEAWIEASALVRPSSFGADATTLQFLQEMGYAGVVEAGEDRGSDGQEQDDDEASSDENSTTPPPRGGVDSPAGAGGGH